MGSYIPDGEFLAEVEQCLGSSSRDSSLDRISIRGTCGLEQIVPLLRTKTGDATTVVVTGESIDWKFSLTAQRGKTFIWDDEGTLAEVFDSESVDQVYAAAGNGELGRLLLGLVEVLEGVDVVVEATWRNQVDKLGSRYIESVDLFASRALSNEWQVFVRQLTDGIPALMIGDLEGSIKCRHFDVFGPGFGPTGSVDELQLNMGAHADGRSPLPSPNTFALQGHVEGTSTSDRLSLVINGITRALTWYWVANSVQSKNGNLILYFTGARVVEIKDFRPAEVHSVEHEVMLAEWTFTSNDPARLEAVRKAASMALSDDDEFFNVAGPVLRTAESLFEIARRDVIAEAMTTRRTARQAVLTAANDAAKSAREASAKATERSVVQIAASVGIVVANSKDLLNVPISLAIIGIIVVAVLVSWRVSRGMDLTAARATLDNFVEDLEEYRDTLSAADIEHLRGLRSISTARQHLVKAEITAKRLAVGVVTLLVSAAILIAVLAIGRDTPENPPRSRPSPSPTSVTETTLVESTSLKQPE